MGSRSPNPAPGDHGPISASVCVVLTVPFSGCAVILFLWESGLVLRVLAASLEMEGGGFSVPADARQVCAPGRWAEVPLLAQLPHFLLHFGAGISAVPGGQSECTHMRMRACAPAGGVRLTLGPLRPDAPRMHCVGPSPQNTLHPNSRLCPGARGKPFNPQFPFVVSPRDANPLPPSVPASQLPLGSKGQRG